jgi:hypothetical protein
MKNKALFSILFFLVTSWGYACSCRPSTFKEESDNAEHISRVKILEKAPGEKKYEAIIKAKVLTLYKGEQRGIITFTAIIGGCGFYIEVGTEAFILIDKRPSGEFYMKGCSYSEQIDSHYDREFYKALPPKAEKHLRDSEKRRVARIKRREAYLRKLVQN